MYTSGKEQLMGSRNFIRMLYTKENIKVYGSDGNIINFLCLWYILVTSSSFHNDLFVAYRL